MVLGVKLPGQATSLSPLPELWVSSSCFRAVSLGENINLSGGRSPQQEYRNRSIYFRELLRACNRTTYTVGPRSDLCSSGPSSERRTQSALPPKAVTPLLSFLFPCSAFLQSSYYLPKQLVYCLSPLLECKLHEAGILVPFLGHCLAILGQRRTHNRITQQNPD